jgi:hypothetical protein
MTRLAKRPKLRKIQAHRTLWSVVVFEPKPSLVGLYQTKAEADAIAQKGHGRFVLPPVRAWGGQEPT